MTDIAGIIGDCALNYNASKSTTTSRTAPRTLVTRAQRGDQQASMQLNTLLTALQSTASGFKVDADTSANKRHT